MQNFIKLGCIASILLLVSFIGKAQDTTKTMIMNEVVVTASHYTQQLEKAPDVILVISSKEIKQLNATNTSELLQLVSGMGIGKGTGSASPKRSTINMNGYPASYGLILIDGKRIVSDHIHTGQNIDLIPPDNIERIEIIKGAASSQYGSDALSGVINIITKKCSEKTELSMFASYGSFNEIIGGMAVSTPVANGIKTSTFVNWEQSDGTEILSPVSRIGFMDYTKYSLMNSVSKQFKNNSELVFQNIFINGSNTWNNAKVTNQLFIPSIEYRTNITEHLTIVPKIYYSQWKAVVNEEKNELVQPELFLSFSKIKNNIISFGGEYKYMNFKRKSVEENSQQAWGLFAQDEFNFRKIVLMTSVRMDKVQNIDVVFSPKISMLFNATSNVRIRASLGKGFRAPSLMDLYEEGYGHSGKAYRFGNVLLQPEYNHSATLGGEIVLFERLRLFIYGYYSKIYNMITPVYKGPWPEKPEVDMWVRTNIHKAEIMGAELFAKYQITDNIYFDFGLTGATNRNLSTGGQLPYYPGKSISSRISYSKDIGKKVNATLFVSYKSEKDRSAWNWKPLSTAANDDPSGQITNLKQYHLLNSGLNLSISKKYIVYCHLNNLLKQDIELLDDSYYIMKGNVYYKAGFKINF